MIVDYECDGFTPLKPEEKAAVEFLDDELPKMVMPIREKYTSLRWYRDETDITRPYLVLSDYSIPKEIILKLAPYEIAGKNRTTIRELIEQRLKSKMFEDMRKTAKPVSL